MKTDNCPLCGMSRPLHAASIAVEKIISLYMDFYRVDVSTFFDGKTTSLLRCTSCDLNWFVHAQPGTSDFYGQLQNIDNYYEVSKPEFNYAIDHIIKIKPESLLEIGCGVGNFLQMLRNVTRVRGSEYSKLALEQLALAEIPLDAADEHYDCIVAFQVIEHVLNPGELMRQLVERLNPGGYMLITVPNAEARYFKEVCDPLDMPPHHITRWSAQAIQALAPLFGMVMIEYYQEPNRIEHYRNIIQARRKPMMPLGLMGLMAGKFASLFDLLLLPYAFDHITYPGHTHGVLMRKHC